MSSTRFRRWVSAVIVSALWVALSPVLVLPALAATSPAEPRPDAVVTADALPTVQIDGIAWSQAIVDDTVYAGGRYAKARPAGSPLGTNETNRSNLLSYDISTGELKGNFAPAINGQILTVATSPDGSRIYVGGDFTDVDGQARGRIAAFNTSNGALISTFAPPVNYQVRAIVATDETVYVGGAFQGVGGSERSNLAAFSADDGSLLSWAPTADHMIWSLALSENGEYVIAGGQFENINGSSARGLAKIDAHTGTMEPWSIAVSNGGGDSGITSVSVQDGWVYGTAYHFGPGGNIEGPFKVNLETGETGWVLDCHGDTYDQLVTEDALYFVGHPHYCGNVSMGFPQPPSWDFQHTMAVSLDATGTNIRETLGYHNWDGIPSPSIYHWFPRWAAGNKSGATQAAWTVEGNDEYVVFGGEFPRVNRTAQQGLVRFAKSGVAPEDEAPKFPSNTLIPRFDVVGDGEVNVSWTGGYDADDRSLSYEVRRTPGGTVAEFDAESSWWMVPSLNYVDRDVVPGQSYRYQIRVTDGSGNRIFGSTREVAIPSSTERGEYSDHVLANEPSSYWPMNEPSGTASIADHSGGAHATLGSGASLGAAGAIEGESALRFSGNNSGRTTASGALESPTELSLEAWFRTTSNSGPILGFGDLPSGDSNRVDRQLYVNNGGRVHFGMQAGGAKVLSSADAYNDGNWHLASATLSGETTKLYVDGVLVDQRHDVVKREDFVGYWRLGGDRQSSWPNSVSANFNGTIDDVAVYDEALSADQIEGTFEASGRTSERPEAPTDEYGSVVWDADPTLYWRLDELSGQVASDSGPMGSSGTYRGAYSLGQDGALTQSVGSAAAFDGNSAFVSTDRSFTNPQVFSTEAWFKTATGRGGKIVGFGNQKDSLSNSYDRHTFMLNDGRVRFGVYSGTENSITSENSYNDDEWHHVVSTLSPDGMRLYLDGALVASNSHTVAENYTGYWRVGGDRVWGGASSSYFDGSIDEVAVYSRALTDGAVSQHYVVGSGEAPNEQPSAQFTSDMNKLNLTVDASESGDADGSIVSYSWDFGDGSTGTGVTASHVYQAAGDYVVTLEVSDDQGLTATEQASVTAIENLSPLPEFSFASSDLRLSVDGSESTDSDGSIVSYEWDFGDGQFSSGVTATHEYASAGTYEVVLTVADDSGATAELAETVSVSEPPPNAEPSAEFSVDVTDLLVAVDASGSSDPDGEIVSYSWDFGDGQSSADAVATHTYQEPGQYEVTLTVVDDDGATNTATQEVSVVRPAENVAPEAKLVLQVNQLTITADGTTSTDSDGEVVLYEWDFGDGESATGPTTSHVYSSDGTYVVTLTVTDDDGATSQASEQVVASSPPINLDPEAGFSTSLNGLTVALDAAQSVDPDGSIVDYAWDLGDGRTASGSSLLHTYDAAGTYEVTLTVTDNGGLTSTATESVEVTGDVPEGQPPTASFDMSPSGLAVQFDASASSDPDGAVAAYQWDFGDGQTGDGVTVGHSYGESGEYEVILTVVDDTGLSASTTRTLSVQAAAESWVTDTFSRSVASGFGIADKGGAWTALTGGNAFSASGSQGLISMNSPGSGPSVALQDIDARDARATVDVQLDKAPTGGGVYSTLYIRRGGNSDYRLKVRSMPAGTYVMLARLVSGQETILSSTFEPTQYVPGQVMRLELQAEGSETSELAGRAWVVGQTVPDWQVQALDTTESLQDGGAVGLQSYLSGSAANAPLIAAWDNLSVVPANVQEGANVAPRASFIIETTDLEASFDGAASSDVDGSIDSYSWDFGDGSGGSGEQITHAYSQAGSYDVTLIVIDDGGASHSVTRTVTLAADAEEPDPAIVAADEFDRSVAQGFGEADLGGEWVTISGASRLSVNGDQGVATVDPGTGPRTTLPDAVALNASSVLSFTLDGAPSGGGLYLMIAQREQSTSNYRLKAWMRDDTSYLILTKVVDGTESTIATQRVNGLALSDGDSARVRFDVRGEGQTQLRGKLWRADVPEPEAWDIVSVDSTPALQTPGSFGLRVYLSGSAASRVITRIDSLNISELQ